MGPLISEAHLNKIRGYVIKTREGGATIHCGETVEELSLAESYKKVWLIRLVLYSILNLFHILLGILYPTNCYNWAIRLITLYTKRDIRAGGLRSSV